MPLPLPDYVSPIESAWLAIIFPVPLYPLSLWERARVRGAGWHNMLHLVIPLTPPDYPIPQMTES